MIRTAALSLILVALTPVSALAQASDEPFVFEAAQPVPLAGGAPADRAMAGDTFLLPFAVRNRTDQPIQLRRLAFRLQPGIDLIDPNIDRIDNDRDGEVDELGEGFSRVDGTVAAWRVDDSTPPLAPGETFERALKVRLLTTAEAGETLTLGLVAAGSAPQGSLRAERDVAFQLMPPTLGLSLGDAGDLPVYVASETPLVRAVLSIPSGQITDLGFAIKGSPAVSGFTDARILTGKGIRCDGTHLPTYEGRSLTAALGTCQALATASPDQRTLTIEAKALFSDAEPFADPDVIRAHRAFRLAAGMTRDTAAIGPPVTRSGRLQGPLLGARLVSVADAQVDAGDTLKARFRIVNRGDTAPVGLKLMLADEGAIGCDTLDVDKAGAGGDACEDGILLGRLRAATTRDVTVTARLRDDALFDGAMAMHLTAAAENMAPTALPAVRYSLRAPDVPAVTVDTQGDWDLSGEVITARIGDVGTLQITGTLPEGRYPAELRVRSRLVDAQTGEPLRPASLAVEALTFTPSEATKISRKESVISSRTDGGWSIAALPLVDLAVPVTDAKSDEDRRFTASATLRLRDLPPMRAGNLIELSATLALNKTTIVDSENWAEVLIVEPELDLTVRSPDTDRTIKLNDTVPVAALSCNRGTSAADALVLTVRLPAGLVVDTPDAARVRTLPLSRVDDLTALFARDVLQKGEVFLDASSGVLRGAIEDGQSLDPEQCLALVFDVRRSGLFAPEQAIATIAVAIEPYRGRDGAASRIYPGLDGGSIRFDLPFLRFGPVSEREAGGDRIVAHTVSLDIPAAAGPQKLDLVAESSTGMGWTILRLDENDAPQPWRNGTEIGAGQSVRFRFEARNPGTLPLGWVDTTLVRALAFSQTGSPVSAATRLITRRGEAPGGKITVTKTMALDRDCDGDVGDERIQDAVFEPVKDAAVGDCVIFRVAFRHSGDKDMERIVVRDQVPSGTELRPDAVEILRTPEPLQASEMIPPSPGVRDVVWSFDGLFKPGAEGEVSYAVKLLDEKPE